MKLGGYQKPPNNGFQQQQDALQSAKDSTGDTGGMFFNQATEENVYDRFSPKNQNSSQSSYQGQVAKNMKKVQNPIYKSQARGQGDAESQNL